MPDFFIRHAAPSDAAALADLGARSFIDAFGAQNRAEDMAMYVAKTYGEAQQRREIEDPNGARRCSSSMTTR